MICLYFNSIKVQLELSASQDCSSSSQFQFHKGTIRTLSSLDLPPFLNYFNSIKVQLEQDLSNLEKGLKDYFNSIKVQLEQQILLCVISSFVYFNSIKVQLELLCV